MTAASRRTNALLSDAVRDRRQSGVLTEVRVVGVTTPGPVGQLPRWPTSGPDPGRERMELTPEQRPAPERLWSTAQLAQHLGVPIKTIHQWHYQARVPAGSASGGICGFAPLTSVRGRTSS